MAKLKQSTDRLLNMGSSNLIFSRAKDLRNEMTETEQILWKKLRNRKVRNYKFRRQHPLGQFIANFYCHEARLVIEIDGGIHNKFPVAERDEGRTHELNRMGVNVVRFLTEDITDRLEWVLEEIQKHLTPALS
jgi:very-short-patch-repair endonuclease